MPELPEVEIVKQSLSKKIRYKKIKKVIIKNRNLRFKIPIKFEKLLKNKIIRKVTRFSKYLILNFSEGCPKGTWSSVFGVTKESECKNCITGKYGSVLAANNVSFCLDCPTGKYLDGASEPDQGKGGGLRAYLHTDDVKEVGQEWLDQTSTDLREKLCFLNPPTTNYHLII